MNDKSNSTPLFSVLIANYNNGEFLRQCVDSILNQSYKNIEVVVVDDCSTDAISEKVYEYLKSDARVKIFANETNRGVAFTKKRCVELAQGEICGFVDPDDALAQDAIRLMVKEHLQFLDCSMVYSDFYMCNEHLEILRQEVQPYLNDLTLMVGKMPNHFTTFKRVKYNKTAGISDKFRCAVDRDMVLKLEETGTVKHIGKFLYYYRIHTNAISQNKNAYKAIYWTWEARFDACERRNSDKEKMFCEVSLALKERSLKHSTEYKTGKVILLPLKIMKAVFQKGLAIVLK